MNKLRMLLCLVVGAFGCSKEHSPPGKERGSPVFSLTTEEGDVYESLSPALLTVRFDASDAVVGGDLGFEASSGEDTIGLAAEFRSLSELSTLELPDENESQVIVTKAGEESSLRSGTIEVTLQAGKAAGSLDLTGESATDALQASFGGKLSVSCYFPGGDGDSAGLSGGEGAWIGDSSRGPCLDLMNELGL